MCLVSLFNYYIVQLIFSKYETHYSLLRLSILRSPSLTCEMYIDFSQRFCYCDKIRKCASLMRNVFIAIYVNRFHANKYLVGN